VVNRKLKECPVLTRELVCPQMKFTLQTILPYLMRNEQHLAAKKTAFEAVFLLLGGVSFDIAELVQCY
jgi:hypothetical protein